MSAGDGSALLTAARQALAAGDLKGCERACREALKAAGPAPPPELLRLLALALHGLGDAAAARSELALTYQFSNADLRAADLARALEHPGSPAITRPPSDRSLQTSQTPGNLSGCGYRI